MEKNFERYIPRTNDKIPEIITAAIIIPKSLSESSFRISLTAAAAPVRVLPMEYTTTKLNPMIIVFIPPTRIRNPLFDCFINSEPITAAWPEPIPGRNEQSGAEIIELIVDLKNSFFVIDTSLSLIIFCGFNLVLFFILIINADEPNIPDNNGSKGSLTGRFNAKNPRKPDNINMHKPATIYSSLKIK